MRVLVTGSSGHLGEALVRTLREGRDHRVVGLDRVPSAYTDVVCSVEDREAVRRAMAGVDAVVHTATLHKPHIGTHSRGEFVGTNVIGTLNVLEGAVAADVRRFVLTSTTSVFGRALDPDGEEPAVWVTEGLVPVPKNVYGATKRAAEELAEVVHREHGLPCIVLRISRFFPEADDRPDVAEGYEDANIKVNELLYRRVDVEDVVTAHLAALDRAPTIGFARYVISATTPFSTDDLTDLRRDAPSVLRRMVPEYEETYGPRGWRMFPTIGRVYVNSAARAELGWIPRYDFRYALECLRAGREPNSRLAASVGAKGYHSETVAPYTVR